MAILKIARMGHPVLRRPAAAIADPRDEALRRLVEDMQETMNDAEGTGLAAPQVHVGERVIVFYVDAARARSHNGEDASCEESGAGGVPLTVLVNPDYEPLSEDKEEAWEACLSIPGLAGRVPRYARIRYWGHGLDGHPVERQASGFHARVVQHECDHLDGVLYPQRMTDMSTLVFTSELNRAVTRETRASDGERRGDAG